MVCVDYHVEITSVMGLPWCSKLIIHLPMQRTWIQSLVRELRSHMMQGNQVHRPQQEALVPQQEKSVHHNQRKPMYHNKDPAQLINT